MLSLYSPQELHALKNRSLNRPLCVSEKRLPRSLAISSLHPRDPGFAFHAEKCGEVEGSDFVSLCRLLVRMSPFDLSATAVSFAAVFLLGIRRRRNGGTVRQFQVNASLLVS